MSKKITDKKGRWRHRTISFRVSEYEDKLINAVVKLSGLTKQEYITKRVLEKDIVVMSNPRVYKALRNSLYEVKELLEREQKDEFALELINQINRTLYQMRGESNDK